MPRLPLFIRLVLQVSTCLATGCAQTASTTSTQIVDSAVVTLGTAVLLDGKASVPPALLSSGTYRLSGFGEVPLANAVATLTTPSEDFYKLNNKALTALTDTQGAFHFGVGVPRDLPVIVSVALPGNRRVVGFAVLVQGDNHLAVDVASTYVTEFLRLHALQDNKPMGSYALDRLANLTALTTLAIAKGELPIPDLSVAALPKLDATYALALGHDVEGLGTAWSPMLGHRILAAETVAGTGIVGDTGDGGPAKAATFYRLKSVSLDPSGNMFLADEGNHAIRRIDAVSGVITTIAGTGSRGFAGDGGPAAAAQLCYPRAVALDKAENLYIFDAQNCRVRRIDRVTGVITTLAGNPTPAGNGQWNGGYAGDQGPAVDALLYAPDGGAFDAQGNLYVGDGLAGTLFNTIRRISPTGTITTFAGVGDRPAGFAGEDLLATKAQLDGTSQLFMTPDDQLYFADTGNACVRKIDLSTNLVTTVAGIGGQRTTTPDPDGRAPTQTRLNDPVGVAVDAKGVVFISERGVARVLALEADGKLHTIAGGGTLTADGDAHTLALVEPSDLAFDRNGDLLLADAGGAKLWRFVTHLGL